MHQFTRNYDRFCPVLQEYSVLVNDDCVKTYKTFEEECLQELRKQDNYSIVLMKRGYHENDAVPYVVITCPKKIIVKPPVGFVVEQIQSTISRYYDEERVKNRPIQNGLSIGESGINGNGTLGGCLKDKKTGTIYGLTCGHVLKTVNSAVVQPSDDDNTKRERTIPTISTVELKNRISMECSSDRVIGKTICTTNGYADYEGNIICEDWAIVEIKKDVNYDNSQKYNHKYEKNTIFRINNPDILLTTKQVVSKIGRTTGTTKGYLSGLTFPVKFDNSETETKEYTIICKEGRYFSKEGDSGAWIVADNGDLIGMVFAGLKHQTGHRTYFTPIEFLLKQIEEKTNISLELI